MHLRCSKYHVLQILLQLQQTRLQPLVPYHLQTIFRVAAKASIEVIDTEFSDSSCQTVSYRRSQCFIGSGAGGLRPPALPPWQLILWISMLLPGNCQPCLQYTLTCLKWLCTQPTVHGYFTSALRITSLHSLHVTERAWSEHHTLPRIYSRSKPNAPRLTILFYSAGMCT